MTTILAVAVLGQYGQAYGQVQYQQYAPAYQVQEKVVYVAVEDPQTYYSGLIGQTQRAEQRAVQAQSTDAKIDHLTQIIEQLQKKVEANDPPLPAKPAAVVPSLPTPANEAVPPPPTIQQAKARTGSGSAGSGGTPTAAVGILTTHCARCHGKDGTSKGGQRFFDRSGRILADADLQSAHDAILAGRMPPAPDSISLREYVAIRDLIDQSTSGVALAPTTKRGVRR